MEISLIQAVLVGLWTAVCWSGMLFGIYSNRCLVLSFGVGVILGDIPTALAVGAVAPVCRDNTVQIKGGAFHSREGAEALPDPT